MNRDKVKHSGRGVWLAALRGGLAATVLSIALVAAYSFALMKEWLPVESIGAGNLVIKLVCAAFGAWIAVRSCAGRLPLCGALAGGVYILVTVTVFSLISRSFEVGTGTLTDIAMCLLCGAIVGVIRNLAA